MSDPENKAGLQDMDKSKSSALKKKDVKPIQILLVEELEDIEKKLRENLEADDKKGI